MKDICSDVKEQEGSLCYFTPPGCSRVKGIFLNRIEFELSHHGVKVPKRFLFDVHFLGLYTREKSKYLTKLFILF